jgi:hypothetical protein
MVAGAGLAALYQLQLLERGGLRGPRPVRE